MMDNARLTRIFQATASTLAMAFAWQIASLFFPPYLFPPVPDIVTRTLAILLSWPLLSEVLVTAARIFAGLAGAFVLGCVMALVIGRSPRIESYVTPVLVFLQGIPALSWVVIAIIWFHGIEFRIFFIMVLTTLPAFTFQILDAFRSMSKDLFEMTMSFRPRRWTLFRVLIVPTIVPGILTAWKVNLGSAARVVVVAELVGEGEISWDSKISDLDPEFAMYDPWVTREVTIRDFYAHRSGLPANAGDALEMLGFNREQILHRLRYQKPDSSFRSRWAYTDFGVTEAAVASAKAYNLAWEDASEQKLFKPLGMNSTSSRYADFSARPRRMPDKSKETTAARQRE